MSGKLVFPKGFFWGAATSAYQVEGGNHNDWTEWEIKNAKVKMQNAKLQNWPDYILEKYPNPLQPENYISGRACDHYNRFPEDFDIAKSLEHNAHRCSIEWSRIEPEEGKFDDAAIEHYRGVIQALRERGIEPFVTLWHWTLPIWFAQKGGWMHKDAEKDFIRFVSKVVSELKLEVRYWITGNEFETYARHGYFLGDRPPGRHNFFLAYLILRKLLKVHKEAYAEIKRIAPEVEVGFTESVVYFEPFNRWPHNLLLLRLVKRWRNNPFFEHFAASSDFIGLQHYFHSRIRLNPKSNWWIQFNENKKVSDFGWEIFPEGIYHILKELERYKKPIYITENGLADAKDRYRADYIRDYIACIGRAFSEGVDVRGYFHWSLLDNFEWQEGFWPRFGLVEINYSAKGGSAFGGKTLERRIRPSALEYKKIIALNSLEK